MNYNKIFPYGLIVLLCIATFYLFYKYQPQINYSTCEKCDAHEYLKIYSFFKSNDSNEMVRAPFNTRVLVPFLASVLPAGDPVHAFLWLNVFFTCFTASIFYFLWRKLGINIFFILIGIFWLLFHWLGIIRLNIYDPVTVDVPVYIIAALTILIYHYRSWKWFYVLAPATVVVKESVIALYIIIIFYFLLEKYFYKDKDNFPLPPLFTGLFASIVVKWMAQQFLFPANNDTGSIYTLLYYTRESFIDPWRIIKWLAAIFISYGFWIVLPLFLKHKLIDTALKRFLLLLSISSLLLGLLAGEDTGRLVFLGFPFVMTCLLLLFHESQPKVLLLAFILSVPLLRLAEAIPDIGMDLEAGAYWFPEHAAKFYLLLVLSYFLAGGALLYLLLRRYASKNY